MSAHGAHRKSSQLEVFVSVLQGDNLRTRALDNMMGGALEGKKEDVLQMVGHIFHMHHFYVFIYLNKTVIVAVYVVFIGPPESFRLKRNKEQYFRIT